MKNIISKYKEIIISLIIILVILSITVIKNNSNYNVITNVSEESTNKEEEDENKRQIEANSYYIGNDKLYISYDGENIIEVPGDFYEMTEYEKGTYQISNEKTVFFYNRKNIEYLVYSDDCGKSWSTISRKKDGTIKYIEFIDKDIGYMYKIKDTAMTLAFGTISKTADGGKTWKDISSGINETFQTSSEVKFFDNNLGYITMPYNGGNTCELYVTTNGGKSFSKVQVDYIELEDTQFKWKEIYDSYNIPTKENGKYYLEVGQGTDGDYKGGNSITYFSYNGLSWTTDELIEKKDEEWKNEFDKRVESRSEDIFLKDFENYNPPSSEIKISQAEAEKIAEIGFEEAGTIGETGDKERQTVRVEEVFANNFFASDHNMISKRYTNIKRKCYVFIRENDMGCGAMVYVDVTTGLIIGGQCFGD